MSIRLETERNALMDRIEKDIKDFIKSMEIKKSHIADRHETNTSKQDGDQYIASLLHLDTFYSHMEYSEYALHKAGLYLPIYKIDRLEIPQNKRDEVLEYQREFIIATYVEKNNYYRKLSGMPDLGDTDNIYCANSYDGVDISKPIHRMNNDEAVILSVNGELERLFRDNPTKEYINYIDPDNKVPISVSRRATRFEIMKFKKNKNNAMMTNTILGLYNQSKSYVLDRFENSAYADTSEYYEAFLGIFILFITIQRYVVKYYENIIKRNFFDKEVVKWFFESYSIPWYSEIPLSYLQRVARNMNKLIRVKATDQVFMDIFKLFGLENIDINNYLMVKDVMTDINNVPVTVMKLTDDHGPDVNNMTRVFRTEYSTLPGNDTELITLSGFMKPGNSNRVPNLENVKKIVRCNHNISSISTDYMLVLFNSGMLRMYFYQFKHNDTDNWEFPDGWWNLVTTPEDDSDMPYYEFKDTDVMDITPIRNNGFRKHGCIISTRDFDIYYKELDGTTRPWHTLNIQNRLTSDGYTNIYGVLDEISIKGDITTPDRDNIGILCNFERGSVFFHRGRYGLEEHTEYTEVLNSKSIDATRLVFFDISNGGVILVTDLGSCYCFGDNGTSNRMCTNVPVYYEPVAMPMTINRVSRVLLDVDGAFFIRWDGAATYSGTIPMMGLPAVTVEEDYIKLTNYEGVLDLRKYTSDDNNDFYVLDFYKEKSDVFCSDLDKLSYAFIEQESKSTVASIDNPLVKRYFKAKFDSISNITFMANEVYITAYEPEVEISFMGKSVPKYPFITSYSFLNEPSIYDFEDILEFGGTLYALDRKQQLFYWSKQKLRWVKSVINNENFYSDLQSMTYYKSGVGEEFLIITNGTSRPWYYLSEKNYSNTKHNTIDSPVMQVISRDVSKNTVTYIDSKKRIWEFDVYDTSKTLKRSHPYVSTRGESADGSRYELIAETLEGALSTRCKYINIPSATGIPVTWDFNVKLPETIFRISLDPDDKVLIQSHELYWFDLKSVTEHGFVHVTPTVPEGLEGTLYKGIVCGGQITFHNIFGGITVSKNFLHSDKLDFEIDGDFIRLYDADVPDGISCAYYNKDRFIKLTNKYPYRRYEYDYEKMYEVSFVAVPMNPTNLGDDLEDTRNYTNYDSMVANDPMWGPVGDKKDFLNQILKSEFNYVYSKYMNVQARYDMTRLNNELCYMFKMLVDNKTNMSSIYLDIPEVGQANIFDIIVALFGIISYKLGYEGTIMDTTTKNISVLGFNFKQDWAYIQDVIKEGRLDEKEGFDEETLRIVKAPSQYSGGAKIVDDFLDNEKVLNIINKNMYNSKDIYEYNAYKKILQATIHSKCNRDIYEIDGVMPKTYYEYLEKKSPMLFRFIKDVDEENILIKMDSLLIALEDQLSDPSFKYIFLNVPSLSTESIMAFIFHLIDVFKSYTVELTSMDILYHLNDKQIHNIKMIHEGDNFKKHWNDFDMAKLVDVIKHSLINLTEFEKIALTITDKPVTELEDSELIELFKALELSDIMIEYIHNGSLRTDFSDIFDKIGAELSENGKLMLKKVILSSAMWETKITKLISKDTFRFDYDKVGLRDGEEDPFMIVVNDKSMTIKDLMNEMSMDIVFVDKLKDLCTKLLDSDIFEAIKSFYRGDKKIDISDQHDIEGRMLSRNTAVSIYDMVNLRKVYMEHISKINYKECIKIERGEV